MFLYRATASVIFLRAQYLFHFLSERKGSSLQ
ncbi:hypothetical protein GGI52_002969 [Pseudomonas moraviensis]|uniref:Uncharacterized protein n=1 Tax=Pseudomonas moraviensis TaxID=321662 RepID=A0A7Y9VWL3_9PSED|nr:hypothetical protein [Pseudomonas moraviensis]